MSALLEATKLRFDVERAAELTNRPEKARELAAEWYEGIESGGGSSTFSHVSQDVAGILMAAHAEDPGRFDAALPAEAVGLSCALTGEGPGGSLRRAAAPWRRVAAAGVVDDG